MIYFSFEQKEQAKAKVVQKSARGIEKAFQYISTYVLPHPGEPVTKASVESSLTISGKMFVYSLLRI